jgi:hypothetical protein
MAIAVFLIGIFILALVRKKKSINESLNKTIGLQEISFQWYDIYVSR